MEAFNSIEWINQLAPEESGLSYPDLEPVLSFSLIWNLFEAVTCNRYADLRRIQADVDKCYERELLKAEDFSPFVEFFRNRYVKGHEINILPERLRLRGEAHIRLVEDVLEGKSTDINNVVFALLIIAYRVRNNLFHGEKNVFTLDTQLDLFRAVNALLAKYLDVGHPGYRG